MSVTEALALARSRGVDLVEIAATANPPVCRLVDNGKWRYDQEKKGKEQKRPDPESKPPPRNADDKPGFAE